MSATAEKQGGKLTRGLDLSSARWQTLGILHWSGEALTFSEIARRLGLSRQAVRRLVNDMERDGLIQFVANPSDSRAMNIVPTALGEKRHAEALEREWLWTNGIVKGIPAERIEQAVALLTELTQRMDDDRD
jgi:DNA-binding MarR family transcriptional regulator